MKHNSQKIRMPIQKNPAVLIVFLIFLLLAYIITTVGLMILAFLVYKIQLSETAVNIGIVLIYVLSAFFASFACGRKIKERKFLWGLGIGIAYFGILLLLSLLLNGNVVNPGSNIITSFLICSGSGMLGGMLA